MTPRSGVWSTVVEVLDSREAAPVAVVVDVVGQNGVELAKELLEDRLRFLGNDGATSPLPPPRAQVAVTSRSSLPIDGDGGLARLGR